MEISVIDVLSYITQRDMVSPDTYSTYMVHDEEKKSGSRARARALSFPNPMRTVRNPRASLVLGDKPELLNK